MRHGSLFSGIGGFDLAAEWMGWDNVFHCDWNPFGQRILKHYWPNATSYEDITTVDFRPHRGDIDLISGGFPCQPYSSAGLRRGKEDSRHLWPQMLRAIREVRPRWVVGENVHGILNWKGPNGEPNMVFNEVCSELENEGYQVQPYLLPAASVNAPHKRMRVFFVAYSEYNGSGRASRSLCGETPQEECGGKERGEATGEQVQHSTEPGEVLRDSTYANGSGGREDNRARESRQPDKKSSERITSNSQQVRLEHIEEQGDLREGEGTLGGERGQPTFTSKANGNERPTAHSNKERSSDSMADRELEGRLGLAERGEWNTWDSFPTQSPLCGGDDGLSSRLDSITFPKWRNESIMGYGNAVVPQLIMNIYRSIEAYENQIKIK